MNILKKLGLLLAIPFVTTGCASSEQPTTQREPKTVYSSAWGEEYGETIVKNLGVDLPYIENEGFDVIESVDDFGDPLICIYVYEYEGHDSVSLVGEYANICADAGYDVVSGDQTVWAEDYSGYSIFTIFYADGWINDVDAIEIQFCEGKHNGQYALGIFAFNYIHYDENAWPTAVVEKMFGHDVPGINESCYTYYAEMCADEDGNYLYISISNTWEDIEQEYYEILEDNGYVIDDRYYDEFGYFAYPTDEAEYQDHGIQFKFDAWYGLEIIIVPLDLTY